MFTTQALLLNSCVWPQSEGTSIRMCNTHPKKKAHPFMFVQLPDLTKEFLFTNTISLQCAGDFMQ